MGNCLPSILQRVPHTMAVSKTPSLSPCRHLHSALIVCQEGSDGNHTMQSIHYSPELCILHLLKTTPCQWKGQEQLYAQSQQNALTAVGQKKSTKAVHRRKEPRPEGMTVKSFPASDSPVQHLVLKFIQLLAKGNRSQ